MSFKDAIHNLAVRILTLIITLPLGLGMLFLRVKNGSGHFKIKSRPQAPAILEDPRYGTHHYVNLQKQGIKLHYVEKGNKDNPLILCLHGFPDCWYSWKSVLQEFSDKYWVVAVDMRGYGGSDKPEGVASYKRDLLVEDIRELVQMLTKEKCILMAHDWGGVLGWLVTCKYPELFEKHISLNGPHLSAMNEHRRSSFSQLKKSWYIFFFQCWYLPEIMLGAEDLKIFNNIFQKAIKPPNSLSDDEVEVYKYYFSQKNALTAPINYYRSNLLGPQEELPICKVDSLIVWGVDDTALDKEIADKTYKYCEKLQIDYIKDCGHFILQENPEAVHKSVWRFLGH